jgi:hypothetical protein
MIFFDEFIKKIMQDSKIKYKKRESFGLEIPKKIMFLGTGIPLLMIAVYQAYIAYSTNYKIGNIIFFIIIFYMGIRHIKKSLFYKIEIDRVENILKYEKTKIELEKVISCTLMEGNIGNKKNFQIFLDIINENNEQYLIPLSMEKKLKFIQIIKEILGDKFKIKK